MPLITSAAVAMLASGRNLATGVRNAKCDAAMKTANTILGAGYVKNCKKADGKEITTGVCPSECAKLFTAVDADCTGFAYDKTLATYDAGNVFNGLNVFIDVTSVCKGIMYTALLKDRTRTVSCQTNAEFLTSIAIFDCSSSSKMCSSYCKAIIDNLDVACPTSDTKYVNSLKKEAPVSQAVSTAAAFWSDECETYAKANINFPEVKAFATSASVSICVVSGFALIAAMLVV